MEQLTKNQAVATSQEAVRIRMSRNFGMKMLTMTNLSTECLIQLTKLGYDATPFNQILKQNAKREMRLRLGKVTVADVLAAPPVTTNLLKFMRASIKMSRFVVTGGAAKTEPKSGAPGKPRPISYRVLCVTTKMSTPLRLVVATYFLML